MDTDSPKKLDTIRALLNQAAEGSGATDAEREAFAQRAAALMGKYAVTEAMLGASRDRATDPVESIVIAMGNPYAKPKRILLSVLLSRFHCKGILSGSGDDAVIHVFGHRSDLERLDFLYTHLLLQAMSQASRVRQPYATASQTRSFRANWILGFAVRVGERMDEGRAEALADAAADGMTSEGAEVVLADRAARSAAAATERFGKTRKMSRPRVSNSHGFRAGQAAGGRADLGHGRVTGGRRALPS